MAGSTVLDQAKKVADKTATAVMNAIAGTSAANSGVVDCVTDDVPRPSKHGKCPPHLLRTTEKDADNESVKTNAEAAGAKQ